MIPPTTRPARRVVRRARPRSRIATAIVVVSVIAVAAASTRPAAAQSQPAARRTPVAVKIAKWTLLGAAIGLGAYALDKSTDAADAYDALRALCLDAPARCVHGGGPYADPEAETLYDRALEADRQAQLGIYGGEAALLASVAFFILDLRADVNPPTIPYPRGSPSRGHRFVLFTIAFR